MRTEFARPSVIPSAGMTAIRRVEVGGKFSFSVLPENVTSRTELPALENTDAEPCLSETTANTPFACSFSASSLAQANAKREIRIIEIRLNICINYL